MEKLSYFLVFFLSFFLGSLTAQTLNMEELYHHDVGGTYNDCWGYVDDAGNEYAIVGTKVKILFYDVTDPDNVVLIEEFDDGDQGINLISTTWRDFKTYGEKAYAGSEANGEGLIVFDLSDLPNSVTMEEQNTEFFTRSHNIFIDEATGYLYTAGARDGNTYIDVVILDLTTDPISLVAEADIDGGYIHDLYVNDNIAYCNSGNEGLYVIDFTDPANPVTLGNLDGYLGDGYNHSCWPTEGDDYLVFCDETTNRKVKICDITDYNDITITDQFHSESPLASSIAHNPYIVGDFAYVSYYDDGVYVFDISDRNNVTTHAYFDTNPGNGGSGCWGVYPFLPSGNIIATDMSFGFYLLEVTEGPLPVELSRFEAIPADEKVKLEWTTASEENSAYFEIERSSDGLNFTKIGSVDALGRSLEKAEYFTFDTTPLQGDNYYRLKQVDQDEKFEYSEIVSVYFSTSPVTVYPTLVQADQDFSVVFSASVENVRFHLYNIDGQLMQSAQLSGNQGEELAFPLNNLPNGTYILSALNGNQEFTQRIVIAR